MTWRTVMAAALLLASAASSAQPELWSRKPRAATDLLPVDQAFALVSAERKGERIAVTWEIAPGYYLYRGRLGFEAAPSGATQPDATFFGMPQLPAGTSIHDEQGDNEIYRDHLVALLPLRAGMPAPQGLRVRYQGCADIGVCYPPQTKLINIAAPP